MPGRRRLGALSVSRSRCDAPRALMARPGISHTPGLMSTVCLLRLRAPRMIGGVLGIMSAMLSDHSPERLHLRLQGFLARQQVAEIYQRLAALVRVAGPPLPVIPDVGEFGPSALHRPAGREGVGDRAGDIRFTTISAIVNAVAPHRIIEAVALRLGMARRPGTHVAKGDEGLGLRLRSVVVEQYLAVVAQVAVP